MADAYARLPAMRQESTFTFTLTPLEPQHASTASAALSGAPSAPPSALAGSPAAETTTRETEPRIRLLLSRPNLMRLETRGAGGGSGGAQASQYVSDGRFFWTYLGDKNWYTRDPAPRSFRDFVRLKRLDTGSLELMMALGVNPFSNIRDCADTVRCDGRALVHGVQTDVVMLRSVTPGEVTEARLFIDADDHLLRKLVSESAPVVRPSTPGRIGDPLDELLPEDRPAPTPPGMPPQDSPEEALPDESQNAVRTRVEYENAINLHPVVSRQEFVFTVPPSAWRWEPVDTAGRSAKSGPHGLKELLRAIKEQYHFKKVKLVR